MGFDTSIGIKIPKPTSTDSWTQFYKNISQIGIYVIAIMFGSTVSNEFTRGTLVNLVTKGLPRWTVIVAKYLCLLVQWLVLVAGAFLVTWGYTAYYFVDKKSSHVVEALVPLLVFGIFFLAVILFGSTLARNNYGVLLFMILMMAVFFMGNLFKKAHNYNPVSLIGDNVAILQGGKELAKLAPAIGVAVGLAVVLIACSITIFNRKSLA